MKPPVIATSRKLTLNVCNSGPTRANTRNMPGCVVSTTSMISQAELNTVCARWRKNPPRPDDEEHEKNTEHARSLVTRQITVNEVKGGNGIILDFSVCETTWRAIRRRFSLLRKVVQMGNLQRRLQNRVTTNLNGALKMSEQSKGRLSAICFVLLSLFHIK